MRPAAILRDAREERAPQDEAEIISQTHGMRSRSLMVRRRFFSAVSNHEARGPSFETRAKSTLLRMRSKIASQALRIRRRSLHTLSG
jgi:hypothetical protein